MTKLDVLLDCDNPCEYRVRLWTVDGWPNRLCLTSQPLDDENEEYGREIVLTDSEAEHLRNILNERALGAVK